MRVAVIGVGLIGGSIGLAAREQLRDAEVAGFDVEPDVLAKARAPGESSSGVLYERLHGMLVALGAHPVAIDAETHDRILATVSHLPHVLANVLVSQAARALSSEGEALPRVGPSFRDTTRVAGASS